MAAPVEGGATSTSGSGTSFSVARPSRADGTALQPGDQIYATFGHQGDGSTAAVTPPSGWTVLFNRIGFRLYKRVVGANEPTSYAWGIDVAGVGVVQAQAVQGAAIETYEALTTAVVGTAGTDVTAPSVATKGADRLLVGFFGWVAGSLVDTSAATPPAGMTEKAERNSAAAGAHKRLSEVASVAQAAEGASGDKTATASHSASARFAYLLALRSAEVFPPPVDSAEAFGGLKTVERDLKNAGGIPSAEAFGVPGVGRPLNPGSIPSAEVFGSPAVVPGVSPSPIPSAEAFGAPTVQAGPATVSPTPVPSAEAFGSPRTELNASPSPIPSAEAFGVPRTAATASPGGVPSAEAFGSPGVGRTLLGVGGIASAEAFGSPRTAMAVGPPAPIESAERVSVAAVKLAKKNAPQILSEARKEALMLAGERGVLQYEPRLFLSDVHGHELAPLPGVRGASVNVSNYRDHTWELALDADATDAFDPARDYVLAAIDVRSDLDRPWRRYPLGLYRFNLPGGADEPEGSVWELDGQSLEMLVMHDMATEGFRVAPGGSILSAVRTILTSHGVPSNRITLPPASEDKVLANGAYYDPIKDADGAFYLRIVNNLLTQGGYGALQTDEVGQFFVAKTLSIEQKEPSVYYGPKASGADDMIVYEGIPRTANYDRFANEVFVYSQDVNQTPPITAVVRNENPNSPVSVLSPPQGLGYTVTKQVAVDSIPDQATADLLARAELARSSSYHLERKIKTMPDPRRGADEVYRAEATNALGVVVMDGLWQQVNFSLDLSEEPGDMQHTISRNESF